MSQDHVDIFRALVGRWNAGERDFGSLTDYLDPAIELEGPLSSVVGEPYRGYDGIERWVGDLDEQFAEWSIGLDDVRRAENRVIAIATINARGRASGIALQFTSAAVAHFGSDHRVTRMHIYPNVKEGLEAVGLSE
jgi:SnoaL-like domain